MKKISLLILALGATVCAGAQANVLKDAERAMKGGEEYSKVLEIVTPAFSDPTTAEQAQTYFIPAQAAFEQYKKMLGMKQVGMLKSHADSLKMNTLLIPAYEYSVKALPLDPVTDAKGKVKTKYTKNILNNLEDYYVDYNTAAAEQYNLKDYKGAYNLWKIFFEIPEVPGMEERLAKSGKVFADTLQGLIYFNQGIAAWQLEELDNALEAFMKAKSKGYKEKYVYDYGIAVALGAGKNDTLLAFAKEALPLYGKEDPQYIGQIVNYYLQTKQYDEAFDNINKAIELDPNNSQYYVIKGVIFDYTEKKDDARESFHKAAELDPQNGQALYNYGRMLCEQAFALNDGAPTTQAEYDTYYNEKIKPLFQQAVEVLENAYQVDPDNRDVLLYLENAYYNLKDEKMYEDVQKRKMY
ncbi:MAG: hypothetical protein K2M55_07930 [Muribaculaceae bacterium]|nr:hypothetical protein [Muribaculaceae bacterium]